MIEKLVFCEIVLKDMRVMQASTEVLERLVGRVLRAITQARSEQGQVAIEQVGTFARESSVALHCYGWGLHQSSFDLGIAAVIARGLNCTILNLWPSDIRSGARTIPHGLEALQEIARLNALGDQSAQCELANQLDVDWGSLTRCIRKLTELGLVESNRRRRALAYALTAIGEEVAQVQPGQKVTLPEVLRVTTSTCIESIQRQRKLLFTDAWMWQSDVDTPRPGWTFELPVSPASSPVRFGRRLVKFEKKLQGRSA